MALESGRVGYLPQQLTLPGSARCNDFLLHLGWVFGIPARDRARRAEEALASVGLSEKSGARIRSLSGGMQRRLGFAQALIHDPGVVLLDEPTVGLDPVQRVAMREVITATTAHRSTVVSTHLVEDIRALADHVVVLNDGRLVFDGTLEQLEATHGESLAGIGDSPVERAVTSLMTSGAGRA